MSEYVEGKFLWDCEVSSLFCDTAGQKKLRLKFLWTQKLQNFYPPKFLGYCVQQNIQWAKLNKNSHGF